MNTGSLRLLLCLSAGIAASVGLVGQVLVAGPHPSETTDLTDAHRVALQAQVPHAIPHGASWDSLYGMANK